MRGSSEGWAYLDGSRMSKDEVVEFLVESNTTSDNHFMNFLDL